MVTIEQPALLDDKPRQATQRIRNNINHSLDSQDDLTQSFRDPEDPPKSQGVLKPEEEEQKQSTLRYCAESIGRATLIRRITPHLVFKNSRKTGFYSFGIPGIVANFILMIFLWVYLFR